MLIVNFVGCASPEPHAVVRKFCPTRPERAEAPSPGHRPGLLWAQPVAL